MKKLLLIILLASTQCYAIGWERLPNSSASNEPLILRKWLPHGWLVATGYGLDTPMTYVPDENHSWKI